MSLKNNFWDFKNEVLRRDLDILICVLKVGDVSEALRRMQKIQELIMVFEQEFRIIERYGE